MKNLRVTNNCCGRKCSQCAECCGPFLPLTYKEIKRIKQAIKDYNLTFDYQEYIQGNDIHMQCPFLDMKTRKCKLHMINSQLKPEVCKRFSCCLDEKTLHNNRIYFDSRADVNGSSGTFIPMDLIFFDTPFFLFMYIQKVIKPKNQEELLDFLYDTGNREVAEAIKDGRIKLEWSDNDDTTN